VSISNPGKVLFPEAGHTKLDLVRYYLAVAEGALRGAYTRRGPAYWLSPLADPATAVRLTLSSLRQTRTWRGRTYAAAPDRRALR